MTGMSLKEAIELKKVPLEERHLPEDTLPKYGLYHYLLQAKEEHDDQRKRATDRIWFKATYRLRELLRSFKSWVQSQMTLKG